MTDDKTVLLAGGAGFIGSHVAVSLLESGYQVVIADNFCNSNPENLDGIRSITGTQPTVINIDVTNRSAMRILFQTYAIDSVIHFAGLKAVGESVQYPLRYYGNNLNATLSLLDVMKEYDVKKLVFSSSATVYGVPRQVPLTEEMPTSCTNPYGWTKWMSEQILSDACAADSKLSVVLLRYFNPVGAHESGLIGERPNGIPNNLVPYICVVAAGEQEKLSVFGNDYPTRDGTGVRDYIHVMDLADGHLAAMEYAETHTGAEVFNLGTGCGYSVLEMIHTFEAVNHVKVPYEITACRPGDVAECYAGTRKAAEVLKWRVTRGIEQMCRDAWNWQKNMREQRS